MKKMRLLEIIIGIVMMLIIAVMTLGFSLWIGKELSEGKGEEADTIMGI